MIVNTGGHHDAIAAAEALLDVGRVDQARQKIERCPPAMRAAGTRTTTTHSGFTTVTGVYRLGQDRRNR
jgi:hypothetical protein